MGLLLPLPLHPFDVQVLLDGQCSGPCGEFLWRQQRPALAHLLLGFRECLGTDQVERQRSEEHTSELLSRPHLVCRLLLEKKKATGADTRSTIVSLTKTRNSPV